MARAFWILMVMAGCGFSSHAAPDAGMADGAPDAPTSYAACREFQTIGVTVPVHHDGDLDGADVLAPSSCNQTDAPYGTESAGPDSVMQISGLVPDMPYVVHVSSKSDLAFYVVTGCSTASGPSAQQCLLFEDASTGTDEVGHFIAPSTNVFVVVDYYASHAPTDDSFSLDVYPETCTSSAQCTGATPVCDDGQCVACSSSFDCTNPAMPRCDVDEHACKPGIDQCSADDAAEPNDDGPAGAT
ncbi:MAG TPA: hypothetical protein VIV58_20335, partial [Kofleriaceae bacterium]